MDQSLTFNRTSLPTSRLRGWPGVFVALCVAGLVGFLLLPWPVEGKALAALHGLCAQQPDHSFYFGNSRLPFDARMTGIYGGFACGALYLLARGRWRAGAVPSLPVMAALGLFVALLGLDGVNSTLRDLNLPYAYEPRNELRLLTGVLTGTTLAVFVFMLVAQVGFSGAARTAKPPISGLRDLGAMLGVQASYVLLVLTGVELLRLPLTLLLLVAAVAALTGLSLAFVLLISRRECRATTTPDLAGPATAALVAALAVMLGMGGGRFLLEAWLNIPPAVRGGG